MGLPLVADEKLSRIQPRAIGNTGKNEDAEKK